MGQLWATLDELAVRAGRAIRDGDPHAPSRALDLIGAVREAAREVCATDDEEVLTTASEGGDEGPGA